MDLIGLATKAPQLIPAFDALKRILVSSNDDDLLELVSLAPQEEAGPLLDLLQAVRSKNMLQAATMAWNNPTVRRLAGAQKFADAPTSTSFFARCPDCGLAFESELQRLPLES